MILKKKPRKAQLGLAIASGILSLTGSGLNAWGRKKQEKEANKQQEAEQKAQGKAISAGAAQDYDMLGSQAINQGFQSRNNPLEQYGLEFGLDSNNPFKNAFDTNFNPSIFENDPYGIFDQTTKKKSIFGKNPFEKDTTGGFSWTAKNGMKMQDGGPFSWLNNWFKKADESMYNKFIKGYGDMSGAERNQARNTFDYKTGRGGYALGTGIGGLGTGITRMANAPEYDEYGNRKVNPKAMKAYGATGGLGAGINLGQGLADAFGWGPTASLISKGLGGLGGGLAGGLWAKNAAEDAQEDYDKTYEANKKAEFSNTIKDSDMRATKALYGEDGMKLGKFSLPLKKKKKLRLKNGGKLEEPGAVNVVVKGKLHKENNNLGNKDKGVPVINKMGEKEYEVEEGEIIFRQKVTATIEDAAREYDKTKDPSILESLGKLVYDELKTNTQDNYGEFGVKVEDNDED